jgi:deoxyribodipyrimidine photolyase
VSGDPVTVVWFRRDLRVDAGMRQLAETGWMHNRARIVTASFLVKDLLVDWRVGETHFMRHLVDGDPASNNGGWQWTAGTGTDAAPYFRVLNPVRQAGRFDPAGAYVRRWVPELRDVPDGRGAACLAARGTVPPVQGSCRGAAERRRTRLDP